MTRQSISPMAFIWVVLAFAIGCQYQPMATQTRAEVLTEFNELLAKKGKIEFRSWNGKWIGTDCDTDIILQPGEVVEVVEYADAIARYEGKYQLDDSGVVSLRFEGLENRWPALVLEKDAKSFLLRPKDAKPGFVGDHHYFGKGYWPFRMYR